MPIVHFFYFQFYVGRNNKDDKYVFNIMSNERASLVQFFFFSLFIFFDILLITLKSVRQKRINVRDYF